MVRSAERVCVSVLLGCAAVLSGCQSYTVTVENKASITVIAELVTESLASRPVSMQAVMLGPGASAELGPVKSEILDPVLLNVRRSGDPHAVPISRRLDTARSRWVVENGGLQTWDGFSLRLVDN